MAYCMECGTQLPDKAKFCKNCGEAVTQNGGDSPQGDLAVCPHCGHRFPLDPRQFKAQLLNTRGRQPGYENRMMPTGRDMMQRRPLGGLPQNLLLCPNCRRPIKRVG